VIVDTHVHVVSADHVRYPLRPTGIGSEWFRESPVDVDGYVALMGEAGVDRAVLVQAVGPYGYDNRYVVDAARAHQGRLAGVAIVDMDDEPGAALRSLVAGDGVSGVRLFAIPDGRWLDDPATFEVWEVAAELGVPVVATLLSPELPRLGRMLDRFPGVTVALDHCGFPDLRQESPVLFSLAACPNLRLKVSSLVLEAATDARDAVDRLAAAFGAGRLLWGSDFPQTHDRPYSALVDLGRHACSRLAPDEQAAFLGGNALQLWPSLA
jgi:predicted TIM-barrel fold metal-dependent hydrolase